MTLHDAVAGSRTAALPDHVKETPHISLLGTAAMLFEAPGAFDLPNQRRIWSLARKIETWSGIREAVPGMTNLLISFVTPPRDLEALQAAVLDAWTAGDEWHAAGKTFDIPVIYGGPDGPDLAHVAATTGLLIDDVIGIHTAVPYTVFALGSHPGYGYLGIIDRRLFIPRRKVPRLRVEAGSVSIGGMQTGASASPGPSGWHTIGRAFISFFDPAKEPPAILSPGDTVRFHAERVIR